MDGWIRCWHGHEWVEVYVGVYGIQWMDGWMDG